MKKLLLLFALFTGLTMNAQDTLVDVSEEITTAERVIDKYSGKAYEAVKELAQALKVPAEHVYTVLIRQGIVIGVTWLVVLILSIIMLIIGIKWWTNTNYWEKTKDYTGESDFSPINAKAIIGIALTVTGVIVFIAGIVHVDVMLTGFINPEYYAINEIINTFK